ncbi:hypothetical protein [Amycolatopsis sp. GM8]|uniref:hypothetical protein n=1 Tax=Amycolatopsis sp. GM8 TaxID=2896530 RepID=UPI001F43D562|nr:hypothetical protein [Amycolatopsis sp. GM8]
MGQRRLKTVTRTQGNNAALKDGTVTPAGLAFDFEEVPVLVQAFRRMVRELEFDVCEMAFTTYLAAKAHGKRFTALPVFLVRDFHHRAIQVNTGAGIAHPKDLEGRRVGVNRGYTVTTGVWARGILAQEYDVDLDAVIWGRSGDEHVAEYRPPANVVSLPPEENLADLPAVIGAGLDRPDVGPLIPDPDEAGFAALRSRGHYPINHLVVVKDEILDDDPGIAVAVFDAFAEAKNRYVATLPTLTEAGATDRRYQRVLAETGSDPLPYGIEPNRPMIEELIDHAVRQHILGERPPLESLFAAKTLDLTA